MDYIKLGNTKIEVSRLCFGSLTLSPLQRNMPLKSGSELILYAYDKGINFLDTAELYSNYVYINEALKSIPRDKFIISTKSYSFSKKTAEDSLKKALKELNTDYIDIFLLHEQESEGTIKGHFDAIEYFCKMKEKGIIRAFGISTHKVEAVKASLKYKEIEILHPIINKNGIGILDGNIDDMISAINAANSVGKGIYSMKPLGGGHLLNDVEGAFNFVREIKAIDSIAIGMQSKLEIDANVSLIENGYINNDIKDTLNKVKRKLHIADWCVGCGKCVQICKNSALNIFNSKVIVDTKKCYLCGYCAKYCPEFCIKVF